MLIPSAIHTAFIAILTTFLVAIVLSPSDAKQGVSDQHIAAEITKETNAKIIEEFIKQELTEVNEYATKPLLKQHTSLNFFIKQAHDRPLKSLFFLESQLPKLIKAQNNINSFPYSVGFSSEEKQRIMSLRAVANRTMSYGIPTMKRYFYRVLEAAKIVAAKKGKHPLELMRAPEFRDAIFRQAAPTAKELDSIMTNIGEGEQATMALGWTLEGVTVTGLWLKFTDNLLPTREDFAVFRKKRSEYFHKRLKRIYGTGEHDRATRTEDRTR